MRCEVDEARADTNRGMQDCFRLHPEMYASELDDDEDDVEEELRAREAADAGESPDKPSEAHASSTPPIPDAKQPVEEPHRDSSNATVGDAQSGGEPAEELLPKAAHDAQSK